MRYFSGKSVKRPEIEKEPYNTELYRNSDIISVKP